jgi:hypothetical protein
LVCHGELYRLRPVPKQLTSFYFLVSLGGALGGAFVNFLAPLIFAGYWELHGGVLFCWALVLAVLVADRGSLFYSRWIWVVAPSVILVVGVAASVFTAKIETTRQAVLEIDRNFYGVYRVRSLVAGDPPARANSLSHGITSHGFQFVEPDKRLIPTSYYGKKSGIGLALTQFSAPSGRISSEQGRRLGVIGLGTGTLAAYGKPGDTLRFYEINPDVIELSLGRGGYFTYLADTPAAVEIAPGDARLSLERELEAGQPQNFDLLAVDAFNSDSIPVHLLTREAFAVYLAHLRPGGVLALHISNRYLDLGPLVQMQAEQYGLGLARIASGRTSDGSSPAVWVLLSTDPVFFGAPTIAAASSPLPERDPRLRPWTDDYSNLLPYLRLGLSWNLR